MSLTPLTDRRATERAMRMLKKRLSEGCHKFTRVIGWQGGNYKEKVFWNPSEQYWSAFDFQDNGKLYWCPIGTQDPNSTRMLAIVVQCNPPVQGIDRRCGGVFVTDGRKTYLAHSGKIGGGRKGIGKSAFVDWYPHGNWQVVQWPDGVETEMIVIGRVDGKRMPAQVAEFVKDVKRFKKSIEGHEHVVQQTLKPEFSPEFAGKKKPYHISGDIESSSDHAKVVNELEKCLRKLGFDRLGKDQPRDLFILSKKNALDVLFEVKADVSTTNVYQGIGQLLYHSAGDGKTPRRIFVLPDKPRPKTSAVLDNLGIEVLTFHWDRARPVFKKLKSILQ